jgi:hypothetical protein
MCVLYQRLSPLVPTNQEDGHSSWVEGEQDSPRITVDLNAKLFHVRIYRTFDSIHVGSSQVRASGAEQNGMSQDCVYFMFMQFFKPYGKAIVKLHVPFHGCDFPAQQ